MSYTYNAAMDPAALAFQNQRNGMLNNPAYNVGNGQLGIGAYGTIGGVPIDMLNLPAGLGGGAGSIDSVLQQFDMQNSGILQLGASLAGPNSQYSNLMQKFQTATVIEQQRAQYQQMMQMQQMQLAMMQQQMVMAQQQQMMQPQAPVTAQPAANDNMGLVLAMLLMQKD